MALDNTINNINQNINPQEQVDNGSVNKTEANQEKQEVQNTEKGLWASIKSGFKKIAKGVGALATFLGASAIGVAIYSIVTTVAAVGFVAAITPVLPLLITGAALVVSGLLVYKFLGGGNATQLAQQAAMTAVGSAVTGKGVSSVNELKDKVIEGGKQIAEEVIKSDKNLQDLWEKGSATVDSIASAIKDAKSLKDLTKLFKDKKFMANIQSLGKDLMQIKNEALPSDPNNPGIFTKAFNKLTELKNKLETLKNNIVNSKAGNALQLAEFEKQLTEAFKSGELKENPLETIKNALVDTGTKIMKNALGDTIDPKVFTTLAENLSSGNKTAFLDGIKDLADKINEDSSGWFKNYFKLDNLPEGVRSNVDNLMKLYTDLKSNNPNLFAEVFNSADTPQNIKDMFTNILKGAGKDLAERAFNETIVKNFDVNKLVSDIKTLQQEGTNAAEQAKNTIKAQIRTLTEALYRAGETEGSFVQRGTYFNPNKHADLLTQAQQNALSGLKDLMADLKDNSEALFKDLFAPTGGNDSPSYLGQYLWYFGTGNNANKTI